MQRGSLPLRVVLIWRTRIPAIQAPARALRLGAGHKVLVLGYRSLTASNSSAIKTQQSVIEKLLPISLNWEVMRLNSTIGRFSRSQVCFTKGPGWQNAWR